MIYATMLSDSSIVIVDQTLQLIRRFSSDGRYLASISGPGDGPGEIRQIGSWGRIQDDSVAIHDTGLGRIQAFSADGVLGRSVSVPACFLCGGFLGNGTFLTHGPVRPSRDDPEFRETLWQGATGVEPLTPYATLAMDWEPLRGVTAAPTLRASWAFGDSTFWYGFPDRMEVRELDADGRARRIFRTPESARPMPQVLADHYRADAERNERRLSLAPVMPIFDGILLDPDGNVWIRRAPDVEVRLAEPWSMQPLVTVDSPAAREWVVLDASGEWLGSVTTPAGLNVLEIGPDYMLGTTRDELDVPYVLLHRLSKP